MRRLHSSVLLSVLAAFTSVGTAQADDLPRTRTEFAKAFVRVQKGMGADEAHALLGRPHDVQTHYDPGDISRPGIKEIWRYGTSGHLTAATLGQVSIDHDGYVAWVVGKGTPPREGVFEEQELRTLLEALSKVPSPNEGRRYNPCHVIRAVNLLQPLGKEKALAAIEEFLRVTPQADGVFLVLRTLFDVPNDPGFMPRMGVGAAFFEPDDPKQLPRFPIALEGDIPFLVAEDYLLIGYPEQPESHLKYFREHGQMREKPLVPSDQPFKVLERFGQSLARIYPNHGHGEIETQALAAAQLFRLMNSVYRSRLDIYGELGGPRAEWTDIRNTILDGARDSKLKIRWSAESHKYTFPDGTSFPERERKLYHYEIWKPKMPNETMELLLHRKGPHEVSFRLTEVIDEGNLQSIRSLTIFNVAAKDMPIVKFAPNSGKRGMQIESQVFSLDEGLEIRAQFDVGDRSHLSPALRP